MRHERAWERIQRIESAAADLAARVAATLMDPAAAREGLGDDVEALRRLRAGVAEAVRGLPGEGRREGQRLRDLRRRLRAWPRVAEAAAICAAGHDWPLMPPARALDLLTVQAGLIEGALTRAHRAVNPAAQSPEAAALGAFADIAYPAGRFVALAHLALRVLLAQRAPPPYRFLDVGAGGGMKVALAADLFREADGVEVDPAYAAAARATLAAMGATRCRIEQADGAAFDGYAAYDVLYFYQPMRDPGGLTELEAAIAAGARPGAVLIAPYEAFAARAAPLGLAALTGFVFVKGLAEDGVAPLLSAVARIGPHPVDPSRGPAAALGWLGPLWLACEMNGIRPGYLGGGLAAWT